MNIAEPADIFVLGVVEPTLTDDSPDFCRGFAAAEGPTVGVDNDRATDPVDLSFSARAVASRDVHAVNCRISVGADDLCGTFACRTRVGRPVDWRAQKLCAGEGREADPLGKLQVVTDHGAHATNQGVHDWRWGIARLEDQALGVPKVSLSIDGPQPGPRSPPPDGGANPLPGGCLAMPLLGTC